MSSVLLRSDNYHTLEHKRTDVVIGYVRRLSNGKIDLLDIYTIILRYYRMEIHIYQTNAVVIDDYYQDCVELRYNRIYFNVDIFDVESRNANVLCIRDYNQNCIYNNPILTRRQNLKAINNGIFGFYHNTNDGLAKAVLFDDKKKHVLLYKDIPNTMLDEYTDDGYLIRTRNNYTIHYEYQPAIPLSDISLPITQIKVNNKFILCLFQGGIVTFYSFKTEQTIIMPVTNVKLIACGNDSGYFIDSKNDAYAVQDNGIATQIQLPKRFNNDSTPVKIIDLKCGIDSVLILTNNHDLVTFGNNMVGQCGVNRGTKYDILHRPIKLDCSYNKFRLIEHGYYHNIVMTQDNEWYSFGDNCNYNCLIENDIDNVIYPVYEPTWIDKKSIKTNNIKINILYLLPVARYTYIITTTQNMFQ